MLFVSSFFLNSNDVNLETNTSHFVPARPPKNASNSPVAPQTGVTETVFCMWSKCEGTLKLYFQVLPNGITHNVTNYAGESYAKRLHISCRTGQ